MEKAAREEGHCSKGEKPCHERGRGDKREEERRGEERQAAATEERGARIGCCAPAYLEAARCFLPKLFHLPAYLLFFLPSSSTDCSSLDRAL